MEYVLHAAAQLRMFTLEASANAFVWWLECFIPSNLQEDEGGTV
jgi:hypothetical protein